KSGIWYTGTATSANYVGVSYSYRDGRTTMKKKWSNTAVNISQVLASPDSTVALKGSEAKGSKITFDVTASVAAWAAGTTPNQGLAITASTAAGNPIYIYDSANATVSNRPVL